MAAACQDDPGAVEPGKTADGAADLSGTSPSALARWRVVHACRVTASVIAAALFIAGLYVCLVGSKILIAWLVARSRGFLKSKSYVYINRLLGAALIVFALLFARDGVRFLGSGLAEVRPIGARDRSAAPARRRS